LALNQHRDYPQKVYEVGDVVHLVTDARAQEHTLCSGVIASTETNFTEAKMVITALLRELRLDSEVVESDHPLFIEGRRATILAQETAIGTFGEIDPDVLVEHKLVYPVAAFELRI